MVIDHNVASAVKNFLENYAEIHGLPSPGRSVNRITQSITYTVNPFKPKWVGNIDEKFQEIRFNGVQLVNSV